MSFRREKYVPKGGPDGGDGGKGGSVYVESSRHYQTLGHIKNLKKFRAHNGQAGSGQKKKGADGSDIILQVPLGTVISDEETGEIIHDFVSRTERVLVLEGGRGGLGNVHFKSSTNQAPRKTISGTEGQEQRIRLELKLLADVGLVGLPNAGKSSILSKISRAKPKIADYPFTTLTPQLGLVVLDDFHSITVADIPGLIEGAHEGTGLGDRFLRHIERTRFLIHVIDAANHKAQDAIEVYTMIREELRQFNEELIKKPEIIALNKTDIIDDKHELDTIEKYFKDKGLKVFKVSALTDDMLDKMIQYVGSQIIKSRENLYGDILEV